MKRFLMQSAAIALFGASLAACATPTYPARGEATLLNPPPQPRQEAARPQYAARQAEPQPMSDDMPAARAAPSGSVRTAALAPLNAATPATSAGRPAADESAAPMTPSAPEHPVTGAERAAAPEHMPVPGGATAPAAPAPTATPAPTAAAPAPAYTAPAQTAAPAATYAPPPAQTASRAERRRAEEPRYAVTGKVVASSGVFMEYEVSKGDHVDALAREFSTSRKAIVEANHLRRPFSVRPGQMIKIPVSKAYVVEGGDTLNLIAKRFDVQVAELMELNKVSLRNLSPGQKVALPATARDRGPIRLAGGDMAEAGPRRIYSAPPNYVPPAQNPYGGHVYSPPGDTYAPPSSSSGTQMATQVPPRAMPPGRPQLPDTSPPLNDADVARAAKGRFIWPVRGDVLTRFGPTGVGRRSDGLDIKAPQGTTVKAAADGDVVYAGDQVPGFGNLVLVKHADGWVTAYAHLDRLSVQMRQTVTQGQEIGQVGLSGGVTEPQLHFEVRYAPNPADKAKPVDPALVLPR